MNTFDSSSVEKKIGILEFLKEEEVKNISFTCKDKAINFLRNKGMYSEKIFEKNNLQFLGEVTKVSDGIVFIIHNNGEIIHIPVELLKNVSLRT